MIKFTKKFIFLTLAVVAVYDVIAIYTGGVESSISQVIIEFSYKMPAFTFLSGFVMGHLFWRLRDNSKTKKLGRDE